MKFLLYIALFLSLCMAIMGIILIKAYNHFIFTIYVVAGMALFILILVLIIDEAKNS